MKIVILLLCFLGAVWALPKIETSSSSFKRLPAHPRKDISADSHPRVINGTEATAHSIPYQAYLEVTSSSGTWTCGGVLISANYVLTAGHCIARGRSVQVNLGNHDLENLNGHEVVLTSTSLKTHENYNIAGYVNDIGLIKLPYAVTLNEYINVVTLPSLSDTSTFVGDNARLSGWGLISYPDGETNVLREGNSTVISNDDCNLYYYVTDYHICTLDENEVIAACRGDSGGPLVYNNLLIGIVSFSILDCWTWYPSVYSRVTYHLSWIALNSDVVLT